MSKEYILKRKDGNDLIFIRRDDILELGFVPRHKEPCFYSSAGSVVNFKTLLEGYDVEKDADAVWVSDRYYLTTIHRSYTLDKEEYEGIKRWIMEG